MKINFGYFVSMTLLLIVLLIYCICVIVDETRKCNKVKFYKSTLLYEFDYDKYFKMIKKMKRILFVKRCQLLILEILVFLKGVFIWKKH